MAVITRKKNYEKYPKGKKIMNQREIKKFIMHYERITKNMIRNLKNTMLQLI